MLFTLILFLITEGVLIQCPEIVDRKTATLKFESYHRDSCCFDEIFDDNKTIFSCCYSYTQKGTYKYCITYRDLERFDATYIFIGILIWLSLVLLAFAIFKLNREYQTICKENASLCDNKEGIKFIGRVVTVLYSVIYMISFFYFICFKSMSELITTIAIPLLLTYILSIFTLLFWINSIYVNS